MTDPQNDLTAELHSRHKARGFAMDASLVQGKTYSLGGKKVKVISVDPNGERATVMEIKDGKTTGFAFKVTSNELASDGAEDAEKKEGKTRYQIKLEKLARLEAEYKKAEEKKDYSSMQRINHEIDDLLD